MEEEIQELEPSDLEGEAAGGAAREVTPKRHQLYAVEESAKAAARGVKRILVSAPTGGGKTWIAAEKIRRWTESGFDTNLYTNRKLLVAQLSRMLKKYGIEHGIMASGRKEAAHHPVQICSVQTDQARSRKAKKMAAERLVRSCHNFIIDEAHLNTGPGMEEISKRLLDLGAVKLGLTATPMDMEPYYDLLIQAGTVSELRECGMLVPAIHYAPDEPDLKSWKKLKKSLANIEQDSAELTEGQVVAMFPLKPELFGRVWEWFDKLNPEEGMGRGATILFAPDVKGSYWFAQQFDAKGVTAAHLDGDFVWRSGWDEPRRSTPTLRREILKASETGEICVLCTRFVLREGVDAPWIMHLIFATIFGSLKTYLQSGGRGLRACINKPHVTIQDHGGNWWRFKSLNLDRYWNLSDTSSILAQKHADEMISKTGKEPFRCPECARIMMSGKCLGCGWVPMKQLRSRPVVTTDGKLRLMTGDIYRAHGICKRPDGPKKWERIFWASRKNSPERTFRVAAVLFAKDNYWQYPDRSWPLMPINNEDWYRAISSVPFSDLVPKGESNGGRNDRSNERRASEEGSGTSQEDRSLFSDQAG